MFRATPQTWYPPRSNVVVGVYHDYHWQKYVERAALRGNDDGWQRLWEPLARYVAGVERRGADVRCASP